MDESRRSGQKWTWICFVFLLIASSCSWHPHSKAYQELYTHTKYDFRCYPQMQESKYFVLLLVDARHLDYTEGHSLLRTIAKHPTDGSKNGDVGHAWIYLQGVIDGQNVFVEGGHSGERGILQPKYFEGVMDHIDCGDPNAIRYLWEVQKDGFFQVGSGGHRPTFAAKVTLSEEQFFQILSFMQPENYPYQNYSLRENQCCSFVAQIASIAGIALDYEVEIAIPPRIQIAGGVWPLWRDPRYAFFSFSSPDILERSLMDAVRNGKAEYALNWYLKRHRVCLKHRLGMLLDDVRHLPDRLERYFLFF